MNGNRSVFVSELEVLDEAVFTQERFSKWYNILVDFAVESIDTLREEIGNIDGITYEINTVLLHEVVFDAIVGLKTIVTSENNEVEAPNPFKIAAYLGYWFLRHKPIIFRAEQNFDVEELFEDGGYDENKRKEIIMDIKHLNEVAVARFLISYIFKVDASPVCKKNQFKKIKSSGCMFFDNFEDMLDTVFEKLKYFLTYREISPKTIEHFLEAYSLHPYLPYRCDLWNTEE